MILILCELLFDRERDPVSICEYDIRFNLKFPCRLWVVELPTKEVQDVVTSRYYIPSFDRAPWRKHSFQVFLLGGNFLLLFLLQINTTLNVKDIGSFFWIIVQYLTSLCNIFIIRLSIIPQEGFQVFAITICHG